MKKRDSAKLRVLLRNSLQEQFRSFGLSPRERQIAHWLLQGYTNKEIAARGGLSVQTVKDHLKRTYGKTGARNRTALLALLLRTSDW